MDRAQSSLDADTPIYRIIDFFDFAAILETALLRIPKASIFVDENEGIDVLLHDLEWAAGPCRGAIGYLWESHDEAVATHASMKHEYFVSSWSLVPESIAMWSLYSDNILGVRVRTTVGKLQDALTAYQRTHGRDVMLRANENEPVKAVGITYVEKVKYANLARLHKRASNRQKAFLRLEARLLRQGKELEADLARNPFFLELPDKPFLLKDAAYSHEVEVRGVFRVGHATLDSEWLALIAARKGTAELQYLPQGAAPDDFPNHLYIPVSEDFVEEICIDSRCPEHKSNFMRRFSERHGVEVAHSTAFGYLPTSARFTCDQ